MFISPNNNAWCYNASNHSSKASTLFHPGQAQLHFKQHWNSVSQILVLLNKRARNFKSPKENHCVND